MKNIDFISDIIFFRIYSKKMKNWAMAKSLTLGIEVWHELSKEESQNQPHVYSALFNERSFCGLPIKISHKRPRLIQANMDIKRKKSISSLYKDF